MVYRYYNYLNRAKYKIVNYDDELLKNYNNDNLITYIEQAKERLTSESTVNKIMVIFTDGYCDVDFKIAVDAM